MTRIQFNDSLTRLRTSAAYQDFTEPEQVGMIESVLETELPFLLVELRAATLVRFEIQFPQYAELTAPYSSLQEAYSTSEPLRNLLNQWSVERFLAQHTELVNAAQLDTDGSELAPAGEYHGMNWQQVFALHPELAYKLPQTEHELVENIRWWACPASGGNVPATELDAWWQEQFSKPYLWEETNG